MGFASPQEAMAFYGEVINQQRFDALLPVLADDVSFWFSSGSHSGLAASRKAFETTWARIVDEHYWLENLHWLSLGDESAACSYHFRWNGRIDNAPPRAADAARPSCDETPMAGSSCTST